MRSICSTANARSPARPICAVGSGAISGGKRRSDALAELCQKKSEIETLAVSADGRWLAIGVAHGDGLYVWDLQTRQEVAHLAEGRFDARAAFSPTEPLLAFSAADDADDNKSHLTIWNTATRQLVSEFPLDGRCENLEFSLDGKRLLTSTQFQPNGQIILWRVSDGTQLASYPSRQIASQLGSSDFAATSDLTIAAWGEMQKIHVVDLSSGKELWNAVASQDLVNTMAFSPDGKTLATTSRSSDEPYIRLWDVATGKEIGRLQGHTSWISSVVFWPDGKKLASASADQTIRTWDLASRACTDVMRGHRLEVWRLALLPDDKTLVSGSKDGVVCLWDTSITHPRREYITLSEKIYNCCFASHSQTVLTLDSAGQVARWSGTDFQEKEPLVETGAKKAFRGYSCFSGDGRFLAVGLPDGNLSVWDVSRRALCVCLEALDGLRATAEFSCRGQWIGLLHLRRQSPARLGLGGEPGNPVLGRPFGVERGKHFSGRTTVHRGRLRGGGFSSGFGAAKQHELAA